MESCGEAVRLRAAYLSALSAFHAAQIPTRNLRRNDPDFQLATERRENAHNGLLLARRRYWHHVHSHGCGATIG
jgi:hypothetical protein